jgi:hypothetical protein
MEVVDGVGHPLDLPLRFDAAKRDFFVHGQLLFRLGRNSSCQSAILSLLEGAGWPECLGLLGAAQKNGFTAQSLRDAVKAINARQSAIALHVKHGGLRWEWTTPVSASGPRVESRTQTADGRASKARRVRQAQRRPSKRKRGVGFQDEP